MTNIPILEVRDLTVVYNANTPYEVVALKNFSLKVEKGEIVIITGGNGTGKSTLLAAISGTIPIKSGQILINGIDVTRWNANKRAKYFGTVHQDTMLGTCPNLTIQENFQLTNTKKWWLPIPYNLKLNKNQLKRIENIGLLLETRSSSKINMLSGGQRQAIAVCLAFENNKPILLFDEFTSSLDEKTRKNVIDFTMLQSKYNETTLLMVLHNIQEMDKYNVKFIRL
jgi:putative ABC transport system ATP-binding protein